MFITLSIVLFNLRFWLRFTRPKHTLPKILKILPHLNDTLLFITGMMMMSIAKWQPFGAGGQWLGIKLILIVVYIGTGFVCMKNAPRSPVSNIAYVIGLVLIAMVVYLARIKPILG